MGWGLSVQILPPICQGGELLFYPKEVGVCGKVWARMRKTKDKDRTAERARGQMRDPGNRGVRASRRLRPTGKSPRPSLEGSVRGRGGDRRATLAGAAGTPTHGSLSPETQSQLRKGRAGRGVPGPGAPLPPRAARPPTPASAAAGPAGAGGPDRAGLGGAPGAAAQRREPPAGTWPGTPAPDGPGPPGTSSGKRQPRTPSARTPLFSPAPLPAP